MKSPIDLCLVGLSYSRNEYRKVRPVAFVICEHFLVDWLKWCLCIVFGMTMQQMLGFARPLLVVDWTFLDLGPLTFFSQGALLGSSPQSSQGPC